MCELLSALCCRVFVLVAICSISTPCRCAEVLVLVMFTILALLWLTREPRFIPGWGEIFETEESGKRYAPYYHKLASKVLVANFHV